MDFDRLNRWLTLLANLGVLIGIIFLAVELDQANTINRYSSEATTRDRWVSITQTAMDHPDVLVKLRNSEELSPQEQVKAVMWARQLTNSWEDAETAYRYGLLSAETFELVLNDVNVVVKETPGIVPYFKYLLDAYKIDTNVYRVWAHIADIVKTEEQRKPN